MSHLRKFVRSLNEKDHNTGCPKCNDSDNIFNRVNEMVILLKLTEYEENVTYLWQCPTCLKTNENKEHTYNTRKEKLKEYYG